MSDVDEGPLGRRLTRQERQCLDLGHAMPCHCDCGANCATNTCTCSTNRKYQAVERIIATRLAEAEAATAAARAQVDALLNAAHDAADELDEWDGHPSVTLGGSSPGGVVRHAAHEARGVSIDECPACDRYRTGGE